MLVKDLEGVIYSKHGDICTCIVYEPETGRDLARGCSAEYAIERYGHYDLVRIEAYQYDLVLYVTEVRQ